MSGTPRATRFAPSPTGRLHLGHALSAVRAFDLARAEGGRFLLRIEDIDGTRSRPEHVDAILRDLEWLGLEWDDLSFQSQRLDLYAAAQARLADLLYPCFCTRAEIAASLSAPHGPVALYPGTCRHRSAAERAARMGEPHGWRIDMTRAVERTGPLYWQDEQAGPVLADPLSHGDVILARKDAPASYHLAATVDDAAQGVTDVVRGLDLFEATHVHRLLQALLGLPTPLYHHHPLIVGADGQRLAKRHGAPALAAMREGGADGRALADALRRNMLPAGFRLGEA
ncbi:tRNA glutamyl-Q(34) synthetase GluQRS [Sphingomonas sanguinis]|jgi:glutamyl-Q tRNA(Asp) synthetase|uniref:tRNA glutamyl-Q(34) synthetase GluQRS n=1 Tax=Sphingomonas sanguinis TaxID=33051 RepID=A0A7Y7QWV7_9SPHN|nr:tRNA glutamyl-Q(34) synthetase GluQRS [Sphingomonas sanguinis]MBZ6382612.1 tRNA glutamyl-Q(34) synthetase GluQRS [Sphingomonas sanguinis]NNG50121.1 tRNA glutamyl-Q(34) synthetase GluQRS [Sphingomonas sanguinis]NNG54497.1 tRNA glutamyl-Q(34) synthetase GluQRS [Sphingomonas sanguinis]NVP31911.1 tRNA glutamyl-Q(34) synthetase GluQRS [Sphingomonas sanguinis]